jgi:hypothetical protein
MEDKTAFLAMVIVFFIFFGIFFALNITAESVLLLKYSLREDRERNIGTFRAATGVGSAFSPFLISALISFSDYWTCFVFVAVFLLIATPFI